MKIQGTVTDKHVHKGKCGSSEKCAVALAMLDAGFRRVAVNDDALHFRDNNCLPVTSVKTTKRLERFINQFDDIEDSADEYGEYVPDASVPKDIQKQRRAKLSARLKAHPIPFTITLSRDDAKVVLKPAVFKKLDGR